KKPIAHPFGKRLQGWPIFGLRGTSPLPPDQLAHPGWSNWNRDRTSLPNRWLVSGRGEGALAKVE
ncbi:MAG: hypothetical protein VX911_05230, partial [Candidatus Latescibacterota bacterium]|nr:hypothetical protein [Candidatus Latescibacterota bacterium]